MHTQVHGDVDGEEGNWIITLPLTLTFKTLNPKLTRRCIEVWMRGGQCADALP